MMDILLITTSLKTSYADTEKDKPSSMITSIVTEALADAPKPHLTIKNPDVIRSPFEFPEVRKFQKNSPNFFYKIQNLLKEGEYLACARYVGLSESLNDYVKDLLLVYCCDMLIDGGDFKSLKKAVLLINSKPQQLHTYQKALKSAHEAGVPEFFDLREAIYQLNKSLNAAGYFNISSKSSNSGSYISIEE